MIPSLKILFNQIKVRSKKKKQKTRNYGKNILPLSTPTQKTTSNY